MNYEELCSRMIKLHHPYFISFRIWPLTGARITVNEWCALNGKFNINAIWFWVSIIIMLFSTLSRIIMCRSRSLLSHSYEQGIWAKLWGSFFEFDIHLIFTTILICYMRKAVLYSLSEENHNFLRLLKCA